MDLSLNADQRAILDAIDALAEPYETPPVHDTGFHLASDALDRALAEGGFLDVALEPDLGAVTAALVVERLARLPYAVEAAASALVRPLIDAKAPRPFCLVRGPTPLLVRFLKPGASVAVISCDRVATVVADAAHVAPEETLYAYPMATLRELPAGAASPAPLRLALARWRTALAAEAAGLLAAALRSCCGHISDRRQFGRPLASFQALRHRLAEIEARRNGVYWLALKAASTDDPADAALAALHAQETATRAVYDFHQFLGAMGMTLEHPLHLWTYRLKALIGELGGRGAQGLAAAEHLWPAP